MPEFAPLLVLDQIDGTNGYLIAGAQFSSKFAEWVASAGDINGDGFEDIIISADEYDFGATTKAGAVYVLFGGAAGLAALDIADGLVDGIIQTSLLDGYNGFQVHGTLVNQQFGQSVNGAGDVDGDGFDDLIIGVDNLPGGQVYLLFGKATGFAASGTPVLTAGADGYIFSPVGPNSGDDLGYSVSSAGDFNGDGFDDFIIGARFADPNSGATNDGEGAAYLVFGGRANLEQLDGDDGATGGAINLGNLSVGEGVVISTTGTGQTAGYSVSALGDINGDGFDDIGVTAPNDDPFGGTSNEGRAMVLFGRPDSIGIAPLINGASLNGVQGFWMGGLNAGDRLGDEISGGGDVNGDGFDDIIVTAARADPYGISSAGSAYVVFGKSVFRRNLDLSTLDGSNGFRVHGARTADYTGISASILGDINGDGFDDVAIGAHFFDSLAGVNVGALYVVFGKAGGFEADIDLTALNGNDGFRIEGTPEFKAIARNLGQQLGDINGDGFDDILVGAYGGFADGEAFIIFGHKAEASVVRMGTDLSQTQNGGIGDDEIYGNDGDDTLIGHEGDDLLDGGAGNDILIGGAGADEHDGGSGTDRASYITAASGIVLDLALPGASTGDAAGDTFLSIEEWEGSTHSDDMRGDDSGNTFFGDAGDDTINGRGGDDTLFGGSGADLLNGGSGVDRASYMTSALGVLVDLAFTGANSGDALGDQFVEIEDLEGSAFDDELRGDDNANTILGGAGADTIYGRGGNDMLLGGAGDDVLLGGVGRDVLDGGAGQDRAQYHQAAAGLQADLAASHVNTGEADGDTYTSIEDLLGSNFNDTLSGDDFDNVISGHGGNDTIFGRAGNDTLNGGAGDDVLIGGAGVDTYNGGAGIDRVQYQDSPVGLRVDLQNPGTNTGDAAGETYVLIEDIVASSGGDSLFGNASANRLFGFDGVDRVFGRAGNDTLFGGNGNDILNGGADNDILVGGQGVDTFRFDGADFGSDRITDFGPGEVIDLTFYAGLTFGDLTVADVAGRAEISFANGEIVLTGIQAANVTAGMFDFAP